MVLSLFAATTDLLAGRLGYATGKLVGVKESWEDLKVEQWGQAVVRGMFM